ncbi:hypothetical protein AVEN_134718-1 [Araneus ventricosus]|uniref:Uncharacterized protein n=1 Tax=Araneus ventricosus TaxID=182803 RepID=A0A4Y2UM73_ARAVE|nr:hypothetical protein AVEN_6669-1 [Araneus ventricosus]GBO13254.1 hypothetical protein AVEN_134718-1 [Araneus ventricosus]
MKYDTDSIHKMPPLRFSNSFILVVTGGGWKEDEEEEEKKWKKKKNIIILHEGINFMSFPGNNIALLIAFSKNIYFLTFYENTVAVGEIHLKKVPAA